MVDVAVIFGAERLRAQKELKEIVEFETRLANVTATKTRKKKPSPLHKLCFRFRKNRKHEEMQLYCTIP